VGHPHVRGYRTNLRGWSPAGAEELFTAQRVGPNLGGKPHFREVIVQQYPRSPLRDFLRKWRPLLDAASASVLQCVSASITELARADSNSMCVCTISFSIMLPDGRRRSGAYRSGGCASLTHAVCECQKEHITSANAALRRSEKSRVQQVIFVREETGTDAPKSEPSFQLLIKTRAPLPDGAGTRRCLAGSP
jgi:hypothetical protein